VIELARCVCTGREGSGGRTYYQVIVDEVVMRVYQLCGVWGRRLGHGAPERDSRRSSACRGCGTGASDTDGWVLLSVCSDLPCARLSCGDVFTSSSIQMFVYCPNKLAAAFHRVQRGKINKKKRNRYTCMSHEVCLKYFIRYVPVDHALFTHILIK
jgi:hypothetical protein